MYINTWDKDFLNSIEILQGESCACVQVYLSSKYRTRWCWLSVSTEGEPTPTGAAGTRVPGSRASPDPSPTVNDFK